ncbi:tryptophan synthase subunit alpha [Phycisphaeraceae bacterium D3-23]
MNRIDQIFGDLRASGAKALMPFITAGDGGLDTTARVIPALERGGASVCEVGIPFSDPIADGPVIQASMTRALDAGTRLAGVFETIAALRGSVSMGLVAMVSYSIVYRYGLDRFVKDAGQAGFDGLILPDLPIDEAAAARDAAGAGGLTLSMLIPPTTQIERARRIAEGCTGFVYVVSRGGITGERSALPEELPGRLRELRGVTDAPMAVGFGISTAPQVRSVVTVADAAIVGSAMVRRLHEQAQAGEDPAQAAEQMTRELAAGLVGTPGAG